MKKRDPKEIAEKFIIAHDEDRNGKVVDMII